jgi:hypothetical protein
MRNAYKILAGKPEGRNHSVDHDGTYGNRVGICGLDLSGSG